MTLPVVGCWCTSQLAVHCAGAQSSCMQRGAEQLSGLLRNREMANWQLGSCHHAGAVSLPRRLQDAGLHFLGAVPEDKLLRAVRLDEVLTALEADFTFGSKVQLDQVCCTRRLQDAAAMC